MIYYAPAKINLGLQILRKRNDGFHDLSSLMIPIPFHDIIEIQKGTDKGFNFSSSGIDIPGKLEDNLCHKAWKLFCEKHQSLSIRIHLHKQIPFGAGLGGGSSDASTILKALNDLTNKPFTNNELKDMAAQIGSDCPLFIDSKAAHAEGRGEILSPIELDLSQYQLVLLKPEFGVSTKEAYSSIQANDQRPSLIELIKQPIESWKNTIHNDFEDNIFQLYPELATLKQELYNSGATYASMSGSGSALFALFTSKANLSPTLQKHCIFTTQQLTTNN